MAVVSYQKSKVVLQDNESVLQGLERLGEKIPSSCRSGACQCCLMRAVAGAVPAKSQEGLKETLKSQHYFLACQCVPTEDLAVTLPADDAVPVYTAQVISKKQLNEEITSIRLSCPAGFRCRPGQYIQVMQDSHIRSYSVASLPIEDGFLELHVRKIPGGSMSTWFHETCQPGMQCSFRGPFGSFFYVPDADRQFPILLVGTGSGLAPLEGIARDALQQEHEGPVVLIHGSLRESGLYHGNELTALQSANKAFSYRTSVVESGETESADIRQFAKSELTRLGAAGARIFLCGAPDLVNDLKVRLFLAGAASSHIHCDPFITNAAST